MGVEGDDASGLTRRPRRVRSGRGRLAGLPSWVLPLSNRLLARVVLALLVATAALWAFRQLAGLVALIALSLFFSLALDPAVTWLAARRDMGRVAATGVVFVAVAVVAVLLIGLVVPLSIELAERLGGLVPNVVDGVNTVSEKLIGRDVIGAAQTESGQVQLSDAASNWLRAVLGSAIGIATSGVALVFHLSTLALFTFYLTAGAPGLLDTVARRLPEDSADQLRWAWATARDETGGYFYSRLLLMLINGTLFLIVLLILGVDPGFAIPLAVFEAFLAEFIPAVGTYIGAAIPLLFVLIEIGVAPALALLVWTVAYQQVENAWLSPRISASTMSLNAGVAFGAALAGGALFGPIGAFVALPVAGMITALVRAYDQSELDDAVT